MPDPIYTDPDLVQFYDLASGWAADGDFVEDFCVEASSVLDLGCGTGMIAARLAQNGVQRVVGVDPAMAMLSAARARQGGRRVEWIEGDARDIHLGEAFERIILTGHTFQVFVTAADRLRVLQTIAEHLAPHGRFVLDSRNPHARAWERWTPGHSRRILSHPALGHVLTWHDAASRPDGNVLAFTTHFQRLGDGRHMQAESRIAFPRREEIAGLLDEAGLEAESWYGDWEGSAFASASSPEIVVVGRARAA